MPITITDAPSLGQEITGTIDPSDTEDIVLGVFDDFLKGEFIIVLYNTTEIKFKGLNATVVRQTSDLDDSIYGRIGDDIDISLNFIKIGTEAILRLTNSETYAVSLKMDATILEGA